MISFRMLRENSFAAASEHKKSSLSCHQIVELAVKKALLSSHLNTDFKKSMITFFFP